MQASVYAEPDFLRSRKLFSQMVNGQPPKTGHEPTMRSANAPMMNSVVPENNSGYHNTRKGELRDASTNSVNAHV